MACFSHFETAPFFKLLPSQMRRATSLKEGGFAFSQSLLTLKFIVQKSRQIKVRKKHGKTGMQT